MPERYAIYFTLPEQNSLYQLAAKWLRHDIYQDHYPRLEPDNPELRQLDQDRRFTSKASQYGLHATLKPPFVLKKGRSIEQLKKSFRTFSEDHEAFESCPLKISQIKNFLALVCESYDNRLNNLASDCVTAFEPFRTELSDEDISKRNPESLSERQRQLLNQWGYPFVKEEFRFHMTLTNSLTETELKKVKPMLEDYLKPSLKSPLMVSQISLLHQPQVSFPFTVIETCVLSAAQ